MNTASFASFNYHGLNNGEPVIADILESVDVLCEEHWLSNKNLNLLAALHNDYIAYGVSGILDITEEMIMHGRPFGGVAFLWRQSIAKVVTVVGEDDNYRCIAIKLSLNSFDLFFCVYLPCYASTDDYEVEILPCACIYGKNYCAINGYARTKSAP